MLGASRCGRRAPAGNCLLQDFGSRHPYLVSAHSWRILFTQTFGGMSSMPKWSVLLEISGGGHRRPGA